jgi:exodeoxyribonuclease-3
VVYHALHVDSTENSRVIVTSGPAVPPYGADNRGHSIAGQRSMKLAFFDAAALRVAAPRPDGVPLIVGGDFNVAPTDLDVYDPAAFAGSTHVTPEERSRVDAILAAGGLVDAYRQLHPGEVQHTWWDYRQGHFHRGMGLRIDLLLASEVLARSFVACGIARDYRKGSKPSDHAPLLLELGAL